MVKVYQTIEKWIEERMRVGKKERKIWKTHDDVTESDVIKTRKDDITNFIEKIEK